MDMVTSYSANPFDSGKDRNEDEQEDFTSLQYFKIPVEISWSCVEYYNHVHYLWYYWYVVVNFWRVKLWQILQFAKFAKVFCHQSFPLYGIYYNDCKLKGGAYNCWWADKGGAATTCFCITCGLSTSFSLQPLVINTWPKTSMYPTAMLPLSAPTNKAVWLTRLKLSMAEFTSEFTIENILLM